MGGDLNQKKSFHPSLIKNQARVYDEERKALEERKRTQQRIEEIKQERKQEELQRQLESAGGRKKVDRVDWMYQGPTDGGQGNGAPEELEAFLLGKRRIVIKDTETKKLEKQAGEESFLAATSNANNARDLAAKMREDPLFAIKRQEQARYEAIMNDPVQRRRLLAKSGIPDAEEAPKKEKRHRRSERREDHGDQPRHKRRRSSSRSRSPGRRRRDDSKDRFRRRSQRYSRSPSSSSDRKGRGSDELGRRRDRSSERRRRHTEGGDDRRWRSNPDDLDRTTREDRGRRDQGSEDRGHRDRGGRDRRQDGRGSGSPYDRPSSNSNGHATRGDDDERRKKLAAMQSAASELDQDRERRLAALEQREKAARDIDDRARAFDVGAGRQFANSLHRKAMESNGLGDRIGRGRRGYQGDED